MQNSPVPAYDYTRMPLSTTNTPPPPPGNAANPASFLPPQPQQLHYPPHAPYGQPPTQHRSITVQMSPRNLIIGGSIVAFIFVVIVAVALLSGSSSRPTPNIYSNGAFPGAGDPAGLTTTTDANGNSVTMGPGARTVRNADGSTTTDANGNTVTQGGSGNSVDTGNGGGYPGPQQSPFQGDRSFPQQGGGYPQQSDPQQGGGFNPQQPYPQQPR